MNPGSFAGIARRTTIDGQRRATYVLTSSNASFPIPSWAQGGKGVVYITGCGGGGGGGGLDSGNPTNIGTPLASGGASAAWAINFPIMIPDGVTTVNVQIGAGGTAGPNDANGDPANNHGGDGGHTSITVGAFSVVLGGGGRGSSGGTVSGEPPRGVAGALDPGNGGGASGISDVALRDGHTPAGPHEANAFGPFRAIPAGMTGNSAGAGSLFGKGGYRAASGTDANRVLPTGFGSGGSGGLAGGPSASAGRPGFLMLEFVEGL